MLAQSNPVRQVFGWILELGDAVFANWGVVSGIAAVATAALLAYVVASQVRDRRDPSISYESASGVGSTTVKMSGVHVTLLLVATLAALTWPTVITQPLVGLVLAGAVVIHIASEKEEGAA